MIISLQTGSGVDQTSYQEAFGALAARRREDDTDNSLPTVKGNTTHDRHTGEAAVSFKSIHNQALEEGGWSAPRSGRFIHRKDPVPSVQGTGWASRPVNPRSTKNRSQDLPARSKSLHQLR